MSKDRIVIDDGKAFRFEPKKVRKLKKSPKKLKSHPKRDERSFPAGSSQYWKKRAAEFARELRTESRRRYSPNGDLQPGSRRGRSAALIQSSDIPLDPPSLCLHQHPRPEGSVKSFHVAISANGRTAIGHVTIQTSPHTRERHSRNSQDVRAYIADHSTPSVVIESLCDEHSNLTAVGRDELERGVRRAVLLTFELSSHFLFKEET